MSIISILQKIGMTIMLHFIRVLQSGVETNLSAGKEIFPCAVGANGFSGGTFEGSKTTPVGEFALRPGYYRADKLSDPSRFNIRPSDSIKAALPQGEGIFPLTPIQPDDGWCDDPAHPMYNKPVKLPFPASHEKLWLENDTYDIIIPIGYNDDPVIPGKGSAIFLHCAKPGYTPTLGCVAVAREDMLKLLPRISTTTRLLIG
jgi:L,D-peptidoglycan transpeptidase YkuD (ErfK/YbiS/YcfS/YnhG family)